MRTPSMPQPPDASGPYSPGENMRGAALIAISSAGYTCNDTAMKFVTQTLPLMQAITLRGIVMIVVLSLLAWKTGGPRIRVPRQDRAVLAWRTLAEIGATVLLLTALQYMAIGDLTAVMQALPLVTMLAAAAIFGEKLGWRRSSAAVIGLVGVLIILRPGGEGFGIWSIVALGAMATVAARELVTRKFSAGLSSATVSLVTAIGLTSAALIASLWQGWVMPSLAELACLTLAAGFLTLAYVSGIAAMRVGEIGFSAPFRYASLLVAIIAGLVVFGEWPDLWTWVGSALVVGAGLYTLWREAQLMRQA